MEYTVGYFIVRFPIPPTVAEKPVIKTKEVRFWCKIRFDIQSNILRNQWLDIPTKENKRTLLTFFYKNDKLKKSFRNHYIRNSGYDSPVRSYHFEIQRPFLQNKKRMSVTFLYDKKKFKYPSTRFVISQFAVAEKHGRYKKNREV